MEGDPLDGGVYIYRMIEQCLQIEHVALVENSHDVNDTQNLEGSI